MHYSEFSSNMSNKRDGVSLGHRNIVTENRVENTTRSRVFFFDEIRGVWIADETPSRVFDKNSQLERKLIIWCQY